MIKNENDTGPDAWIATVAAVAAPINPVELATSLLARARMRGGELPQHHAPAWVDGILDGDYVIVMQREASGQPSFMRIVEHHVGGMVSEEYEFDEAEGRYVEIEDTARSAELFFAGDVTVAPRELMVRVIGYAEVRYLAGVDPSEDDSDTFPIGCETMAAIFETLEEQSAEIERLYDILDRVEDGVPVTQPASAEDFRRAMHEAYGANPFASEPVSAEPGEVDVVSQLRSLYEELLGEDPTEPDARFEGVAFKPVGVTETAGDNYDLEKGGVKFDAGKPRMDLLPMDALMAVAQVLTYGAIKYDDWNWAKGMRRGRLVAAMLRHVVADAMGEAYDEESGLPHTWHLGCCALMLISADARGISEHGSPLSRSLHGLETVRRLAQAMNNPKAGE